VLVFIPLGATHRLDEGELVRAAACTFVAFSLCASGIYLFNDLHDAPADRLHSHKYRRPIASGRLPRSIALGLFPVLLAGALAACIPLGPFAAGILASYVALMIAYSLKLKRIVLLDALLLAAGYGFRVVLGAVAVDIRPSPALLGFCTFFFFSLTLVKLMLLRVRDGPAAHARAYRLEDREVILALGSGSGIMSVLILIQYMQASALGVAYGRSEFIWITSALLLYWISHMWLTAHRGRMTDDPLVFAIKDRLSQVLIALISATAWFAL
jgi:4-hydroxybenzoate polyprenyltransferase